LSSVRYTVKRKPDYITFVAVFLFLMIIALELLLVLWLPVHLRAEGNWELQAAKQEMIELEDNLRANLNDVAKNREKVSDEIELIMICLDRNARYLRDNGDKMNVEQVKEMYLNLKKFESIYNHIRVRGSYISGSMVDPAKHFDRIINKSSQKDIK